MKILWANFFCLLDSSSGASLSVRQILKSLHKAGHDVKILGATIFDSSKGIQKFGSNWERIKKIEECKFFEVIDQDITHTLLKTRSTDRSDLTHAELIVWIQRYRHEIKYFKPEFIFFYGGGPGDIIPAEARARNIPCGAYLVNGGFDGHRWCRDVDVFITDTKATRDYYRKKLNIDPLPIGKFIEAEKIGKNRAPKNLLYVNPSLPKGACIVVMLARILLKLNSKIQIEIVESRGDWDAVLRSVNKTLGYGEKDCPPNIIVTPNTDDMASVYARTKVLFVPSLWWESGARVIAEAQLNGIPVVATHRGGNPEMVGKGGVTFRLPEVCYQSPYLTVPTEEGLIAVAEKILDIFQNETYFKSLSLAAHQNAKTIADSNENIKILEKEIIKLNNQKQPWRKLTYIEPAYVPFNKNKNFSEETLYIPLSRGEKGIFIDCGGYDGCSAVKFISDNPEFDAISFEPNPDLWAYYDHVPSLLVKKAVGASTGKRLFTIDEIDGDGSSFVRGKTIDWTKTKLNTEFRQIEVDCVDIFQVVTKLANYDKIVLKLDVEGAEYEIINRLISTSTITKINRLYVEWHWDRCGMTEDEHNNIRSALDSHCPIFEWDALGFAVHRGDPSKIKNRNDLLDSVLPRKIEGYKNASLKRLFV